MALELGAAAGTAALLSGVVTAFGCAGRLAFGRLFDMLGGHRSALWDSLIMAVAMALMVISFLLDRLPLLLLGLGLLGIGYGGMSSLCAALVRDLFGPRHYPQNLAIMSLQMVPASLLGPMLGSSLSTQWGSYGAVCLLLLPLNLAGALLISRSLRCSA